MADGKALPTSTAALIPMGQRGIQLQSLEDAVRFAKYVVDGGLAPKGMNASAVLLAMQAGAELGLSPMRALSVVHVINGRIGLSGKAALALIRSNGGLKPGTTFQVGCEGQGDDRVGFCESCPAVSGERIRTEFSVKQAKQAGLWGKNQWISYPDRMLMWRAVGHHCDEYYSEYLLGLKTTEELRDMPRPEPAERDVTPPRAPDPMLLQLEPEAPPTPAVPEPDPGMREVTQEAPLETALPLLPGEPQQIAMEALQGIGLKPRMEAVQMWTDHQCSVAVDYAAVVAAKRADPKAPAPRIPRFVEVSLGAGDLL